MVSRKVTIINPTGLHLRPAGIFCNTAVKYDSRITFQHGDTNANAKSVLSVLGACIKKGDEIELICEGTDEQEALAAMVKAVEDGLGE
ncbi:MAG: HPr family phosphocarrier protein [Dorea sp.]|nr:HPr family phosphocarrier protein [Dorea sp.]